MGPEPIVPERWRDQTPRRWGFVGAGTIADRLARTFAVVPGEVRAVAARDRDRVRGFAEAHGIPVAATDVDVLLDDDEIDAIYVATPHSHHDGYVTAALAAGKAVLCEKPLTHGLATTRACVEAAATADRLLLEAMWTRFLPAMAAARAWIAAGDIGQVTTLRAGMGFPAPDDPSGRLLSPALAGGALLDIGVYPLALACDLLGHDVADLRVVSVPTSTGVDGQTAVLLAFADGRVADLSASLVGVMDGAAWIAGTTGGIRIPRFHKAERAELVRDGEVVARATFPHPVNGLEHQVAGFNDALDAGWTEHPLMPWVDSLVIAEWSQRVRDDMGLRYPFEVASEGAG